MDIAEARGTPLIASRSQLVRNAQTLRLRARATCRHDLPTAAPGGKTAGTLAAPPRHSPCCGLHSEEWCDELADCCNSTKEPRLDPSAQEVCVERRPRVAPDDGEAFVHDFRSGFAPIADGDTEALGKCSSGRRRRTTPSASSRATRCAPQSSAASCSTWMTKMHSMSWSRADSSARREGRAACRRRIRAARRRGSSASPLFPKIAEPPVVMTEMNGTNDACVDSASSALPRERSRGHAHGVTVSTPFIIM